MQICIDIRAVFDIKMVGVLGFCSWLSSKQGSEQVRMDLVTYGVERCLDVAAALLLRFGLKFVDRLFVNDPATTDGQESGVRVAVVDIPLESVGEPGAVAGTVFMIGAGSGTGSVAVDGAGSVNGAPVGGQPDDCVVEMLGNAEVSLDCLEAE